MSELKREYIAVQARVIDKSVVLDLINGASFSFPVSMYERLNSATPEQLQEVKLRVGGRALRWESIDEDIWIADVILQRLPC